MIGILGVTFRTAPSQVPSFPCTKCNCKSIHQCPLYQLNALHMSLISWYIGLHRVTMTWFQGGYVIAVVCLSVSNFAQKLLKYLHEIIREGWQWTSKEMIKFWRRSGSPSGYRDCVPDLSLLGDTESGSNRLRCATLQCRACTSRRRHSNCDVITSPAHDRQRDWYRDTGKTCLGGGMHCSSASSYIYSISFSTLFYCYSMSTNHFSGPGRTIGSGVCVAVSGQ